MNTNYQCLDLAHTHMLQVIAAAHQIECEHAPEGAIKFGSPSSYIRWVAGAWRLYHGVSVQISMPSFKTVEIRAVMNGSGCMQRLPGAPIEEYPLAPYAVRDYASHCMKGMTYADIVKTGADPDQVARDLAYAHQLAGLGVLMSAKSPVTDEDLLLKRNLEIPVFLLACVARYVEDACDVIEEAGENNTYGLKEIEQSFIDGSWGDLQQVLPTAEDYAKAGTFIADLCGRLKEGPEALLRFGPYGKDNDWNHLIHVAFLDFHHQRACGNA